MSFGERIKELRESKDLLQRQLAASLEIDTPMFSKIERGDRRAKREQVLKLSELLQTDVNELLTVWLADQVYEIVKNEDTAEGALKVAESALKYSKTEKHV
jgi:transcriptional regulator with XRE-family HTH domain